MSRKPSFRDRFWERVWPKKLLNELAAAALKAADIILGSIPVAEAAKEIKEVLEMAIKDG